MCRLILVSGKVSRCFSSFYKAFCVLLERNLNNQALAAHHACKINIIESIDTVNNGSSIIDSGVWHMLIISRVLRVSIVSRVSIVLRLLKIL